MPLPSYWATPEDFATLFQYFWHRDFPMDPVSVAAMRTDWTIHIGIIVRSIGDLMGLAVRFEAGNRTDAVLRSRDGDEIAIEWEWEGVWGNELGKLREFTVRGLALSKNPNPNTSLKYGVLITYTHTPNISRVYEHVKSEWADTPWPLLLILIDLEESRKYPMGKDFKNMSFSVFDSSGHRQLRTAPAFPWNVDSTRWLIQLQ